MKKVSLTNLEPVFRAGEEGKLETDSILFHCIITSMNKVMHWKLLRKPKNLRHLKLLKLSKSISEYGISLLKQNLSFVMLFHCFGPGITILL